MVALANLYALSDWSIQQLVIGLVSLPLLVALAWNVSRPDPHRRMSTGTGAEERPPGLAA